MKESTVMPMEMMSPATPARDRR
jgi:hypothetical protein